MPRACPAIVTIVLPPRSQFAKFSKMATRKPLTLSLQQARKLVLHSQQLPQITRKGSALSATLAVIEHLGYIQIDTISVIERAHHHTLWNRNPRYQSSHLDHLIADRSAFEYWSHAAAYLPMRDYRHSLPRKLAIKSGKQSHWYDPEPEIVRHVHDRIRAEGPLMAKDFEHSGKKKQSGDWRAKPAKKALEYLYMQGDLMTVRRHNFHKVYDLTERALPDDIDTTPPTEDEHARFLIQRYLKAHGLAQPQDFCYLRKGVKPAVLEELKQMLHGGELVTVQVGERSYHALPESLALLSKPLARSKLKILSPFDNLVIQRHRMRDLFDFDYQIECYVPAAKRKHGYFVLPILWDGRLVARMDCKADRKSGELQVLSLHREASLRKTDEFCAALAVTLEDFARFNRCETVKPMADLLTT